MCKCEDQGHHLGRVIWNWRKIAGILELSVLPVTQGSRQVLQTIFPQVFHLLSEGSTPTHTLQCHSKDHMT